MKMLVEVNPQMSESVKIWDLFKTKSNKIQESYKTKICQTVRTPKIHRLIKESTKPTTKAFTTPTSRGFPLPHNSTTTYPTTVSSKRTLVSVAAIMSKQYKTSTKNKTTQNRHTPKRWKKSRKAYTIKASPNKIIFSTIRQFLGKRESPCLILRNFKVSSNKKVIPKVLLFLKDNLKSNFNPIILTLCLSSSGNRLLRCLKKAKNKKQWKCYYKWTMTFISSDSCFNMAKIFSKTLQDPHLPNYSRKCSQFRKQTLCNKCFSRW